MEARLSEAVTDARERLEDEIGAGLTALSDELKAIYKDEIAELKQSIADSASILQSYQREHDAKSMFAQCPCNDCKDADPIIEEGARY